jgi:diguanylate cyclase (GGDEF)-like protein
MTAYENARLFTQVKHLAVTDGLTGLFNRRHYFSLAVRELALARRRMSPLSAVMVDIDHFKQINDRFGHPVGDRVIAAVAGRLAAGVRTTDLLARYGGEEFALMLPDTGEEGAMTLAERLRAAVGEPPIDTDAGPLTVTISVGVAYLDPEDRSVEDLLGRADTGLYQAKHDGRDQVALARPVPRK